MNKKEAEILQYFRGARHPGKQISIVAELTGLKIPQVIEVLKKYKAIPQDINTKNYKKLTRDRLDGGISEEMRKYIIGSFKKCETVANELHLPHRVVFKMREEANKEARRRKKKDER
jgi:hypothetical protein